MALRNLWRCTACLFGKLDNGEVKYAFEIPKALSILAYSKPSAEVVGLDQFIEENSASVYSLPLRYHGIGSMWMTLLSIVFYWDPTETGPSFTQSGFDA